nr:cell surface glycoprotein 1-like isoform X1 [Procambarus clarkii]
MSDLDQFSMPKAEYTDPTLKQDPFSSGSNRDSLNLDDFEKVEADQLPPPASHSVGATSDIMDDIVPKVSSTEKDPFSNFSSMSASDTKSEISSKSPADPSSSLSNDPFSREAQSDPFSKETVSSNLFAAVSSDSYDEGSVDLLSSVPPRLSDCVNDKLLKDMSQADTPVSIADFTVPVDKPSQDMSQFDDFLKEKPVQSMSEFDAPSSLTDFIVDKPSQGMSQFDDFLQDKPSQGKSQADAPSSLTDFIVDKPSQGMSQFDDFLQDKPSQGKSQADAPSSLTDFIVDKPSQGMSQFDDFLQDKPSQGLSQADDFFTAGGQSSSFGDFTMQPATEPQTDAFLITKSQAPAMESIKNQDFTPSDQSTPREPSPPPRQPTPPHEPSPPPRQPTPLREPSPPPRQSTPPREPSPPPRQPTPPREPSPPPRQPTPPREPSPPPRQPTPPREPSPPPRQPTPPREPSPPPRQPTPPREPSPPLRQPTPPREPTPPRKISPPSMQEKVISAPVQEAHITQGKAYNVSDSTIKSLAVFNPRAWFNKDQLDPRVVDLIYWRDVKKTAVVFVAFLVLLLSLAYVSFISVLSYTSLTVLTVTIIYRVYKNIMQAIQKSQDGHPFKSFLELDTDLPQDKARDFSDAFVTWFNPKFSEIKRLFLVEDLVDSVKFGCLLWCLTYVGSWFNGLTLVTLAVVALFTLPKVYEQNQAQIDQYVGLVRNQVNDVMSKVKAALPIGNKEKTQ